MGHPEGEKDRARISGDGRSATLPDGSRLRVTPPGQKPVDQLVHAGDVITSNYGSGGVVYSVSNYHAYGLTVWGITYYKTESERTKTGKIKGADMCWLNELVAQDGRILKLFEPNEDEVTVVRSSLVEVLI